MLARLNAGSECMHDCAGQPNLRGRGQKRPGREHALVLPGRSGDGGRGHREARRLKARRRGEERGLKGGGGEGGAEGRCTLQPGAKQRGQACAEEAKTGA